MNKLIILLCVGSALADFSSFKLVDLTHPQDENALGWPTFKPFERTVAIKGWTEGVEGQWVEGYEITQNEHLGTHMDAPLHFTKNGRAIDKINLSELTGPGIVIDMREKGNNGDSNYVLTVDDILEWEAEHGQIPEGAIVLLHTGNSVHYHNKTRYYGYTSPAAAEAKDTTELTWPGLSREGAIFLRDDRRINGVGLDALSIDPGNATADVLDFPAHKALLPANIWVIENVGVNIRRLPPTGFFIMAMPYKLKGGSGAPTRLVGLLPGRDGRSLDFDKLKYVIEGSGNSELIAQSVFFSSLMILKLLW